MERLGLVFTPAEDLFWQKSHVQNPTPVKLSDSVFRVFFASRDANNAARAGYFDLDMNEN